MLAYNSVCCGQTDAYPTRSGSEEHQKYTVVRIESWYDSFSSGDSGGSIQTHVIVLQLLDHNFNQIQHGLCLVEILKIKLEKQQENPKIPTCCDLEYLRKN